MSISANRVTRFGIDGQIWRPPAVPSAGPPVFTGPIPDITGNLGDADIVTSLGNYFAGATSYSILPAIEAGWSFDTDTGVLTVDTDVAGTFGTYVVTGTNAGGSDDSNAFNVIISDIADTQGGGGGRRKGHGAVVARPHYEQPGYVELPAGLQDAELAAIAILCIEALYD